MHDLDTETFAEAYGGIKAPEELKADTLRKMHKENESRKEKGGGEKAGGRKKACYFGALAAAMAAALALFLFWPGGAVYVTNMEDGVYYDEVELKDGVIRFTAGRVAISISPNAGTVVFGQESEAAGEDTEGLQETIETKSGGTIVFRETGTLSLPEFSEESWSYIGEQQIYVTVLKTSQTRYQAVYEKDGKAYEITGEGVTQKEFIDQLYRYVKQ